MTMIKKEATDIPGYLGSAAESVLCVEDSRREWSGELWPSTAVTACALTHGRQAHKLLTSWRVLMTVQQALLTAHPTRNNTA